MIDRKKVKRGCVFIHAQWLDEQNQPLKCIVTRTAFGAIYWKDITSTGPAKQCFSVDEIEKRIKEII